MKFWTWAALAVSPLPSQAAQTPWALGNGFSLTVDTSANHLSISHGTRTIWETVPQQSFLSSSAGIDQFEDSSGNFNITQVDRNKCAHQQITEVTQISRRRAVNDRATVVRGVLSGCGGGTGRFSLVLYVPAELPDRIAFHIDISSDASKDALTKLFFTYRSSPSEDFYWAWGPKHPSLHSKTSRYSSSRESRASAEETSRQQDSRTGTVTLPEVISLRHIRPSLSTSALMQDSSTCREKVPPTQPSISVSLMP